MMPHFLPQIQTDINGPPSFSRLKNTRLLTKSWWSRILPKRRKKASTADETTNSTTRNWRSLSPHEPPLPAAESLPSQDAGAALTEPLPKSKRSQYRASNFSASEPAGPTDARKLFTIIEESDMTNDASSSQSARPAQRVSGEKGSNGSPLQEVSVSNQNIPPNNTSSSSQASFHPPITWGGSDWMRSPHMVTTESRDEAACKKDFADLVHDTSQFRQNHSDRIPTEISLIFNEHDNIHQICMLINGHLENHHFSGNSQFISPELSVAKEYRAESAEVWVLGVSLYRMLVGKYPFEAPNDRTMFTVMLQSSLVIPTSLSDDAVDILKRMLSPVDTRASIDLVRFHPWLKPYIPGDDVQDIEEPKVLEEEKEDESGGKEEKEEKEEKEQMPLESEPQPSPAAHVKNEKRHSRGLKLALHRLSQLAEFVVVGPYPPPVHTYRDLAGLGRQEPL